MQEFTKTTFEKATIRLPKALIGIYFEISNNLLKHQKHPRAQ